MSSHENTTTLTGNITRDPEILFTNSGAAVCTFGLAVNRSWRNKKTNEWEEATSFFDVKVWKDVAENVANCLQKGDRVTLVGRIDQETWEDKDTGANRSKIVLVADEVAVSLRWATVQIVKNPRAGEGKGQGGFGDSKTQGSGSQGWTQKGGSGFGQGQASDGDPF